MASQLESALVQGVKDGKVPHAIVYATNKDGSFQYHFQTGKQNCGVNEEPLKDDAVIMLASQSKLLTAMAALKAVELGLIGLDDDVTKHLPELGEKKILTGFDDDEKPILKERTEPITLRHLLSHSSGTTYSFHPLIMQYQIQHNRFGSHIDNSPTILDRYNHPLVSEPGESWAYSPGLDWAGLLIMRLSKQDLDDFERIHFWQPLGLSGLTFWPKKHNLAHLIPQLVIRKKDGKLVPSNETHLNTNSTDAFGGHGVYARLADYANVLQSLLANDSKLLKPSSVDELFAPQLGPDSAEALNAFVQNFHGMIPGEFELDVPVQYGLGGLVFLEDGKWGRKKGALSWGGLFNPFWIIDRESDLAFTFGTQVLPPGDAGCKEVMGIAEKAVYKMAGKA